MWIEAILTKADLTHLLEEMCPLQVDIDDGGYVVLSEPRELELVPDLGLSMTITAQIHWPLLGVHVPVSVRSATLVAIPVITTTNGQDALTLKLQLSEVDVSLLPSFVDRGIVELVNKELDSDKVRMSWAFTETLSHVFALPEAFANIGTLDLRAGSGRVKTSSEALALAILFEADARPRTAMKRSTKAAPVEARALLALPGPSSERGLPALWARYPTKAGALLGAIAAMAVFAVASSWSRRRQTLLDLLLA